MIPGTAEQLSVLPFDCPASVVLRAARLLRRVERLASDLHPMEVLAVIGDMDVVEWRLDKIEGRQGHLMAWRIRQPRRYSRP